MKPVMKLLFEVRSGELWKFDTDKFYIDADGIYHFVDYVSLKERQYHKSLFRGKEVYG